MANPAKLAILTASLLDRSAARDRIERSLTEPAPLAAASVEAYASTSLFCRGEPTAYRSQKSLKRWLTTSRRTRSGVVENCPPELPAHEFAGNLMIDGLLSRDTKHRNHPHKTIAAEFDYLNLAIWIVGAFLPWTGFAALLLVAKRGGVHL
jgi:hypothetical protein